MASPELELQGEIVKRLKADPAVVALVAQRVYDTVPANATFPYVSYGPADALTVDADCITALDVGVQLDVWSRNPGYPEADRIVDAVRRALHEAAIELPTNALVLFEHRQSIVRRDPDGLTSHGIMSFSAIIEQE